ncbi:MAG TPA: selenocysteine-specific translation elongation factor [Thermomicrobiales bacterium]|jgi:small GTP-binding protein|nr:selenocysteine-specific translation elongation factor [Thermomicrobiales bacterium]
MYHGDVTVATAGHVSHGKSSLIEALTGRHPDRLVEERQRGMTIALGFDSLTAPDGRRIHLIDVPGHERLVETMIAGASGMDAALLVVAADDGPMPQTREHVRILGHLGIGRIIVAITRIDVADKILIELAAETAVTLVESAGLESDRPIQVSARTGAGIDQLRAALQSVQAHREQPWSSRAWLPLDRAFSIPGVGTVVTGTLHKGVLADGDAICLGDLERPAKIRRIEVAGRGVDEAHAGQRVALNLARVPIETVSRGTVISDRPISGSRYVDAWLESDGWWTDGRSPRTGVHIHHGTRSDPATIRPLKLDRRAPLSRGYLAQVRFMTPVPVLPGGRFVVRDPSLQNTVAGGRFLDIHPARPGLVDARRVAELVALAEGDGSLGLARRLHGGPAPTEAALDALPGNVRATLERWKQHGGVLETRSSATGSVVVVSREWLDTRRSTEAADAAGQQPARFGLFASDADARAAQAFLSRLRELDGPLRLNDRVPGSPILTVLERSRLISRFGDWVVDASWLDRAVDKTIETIEATGQARTGTIRDVLGISRDATTALLEHSDALGLTRRTADGRVVGPEFDNWSRERVSWKALHLGAVLDLFACLPNSPDQRGWTPAGRHIVVLATSRAEADRSIGWSLALWRRKGFSVSYRLLAEVPLDHPSGTVERTRVDETLLLPISWVEADMADDDCFRDLANGEQDPGFLWYEDMPHTIDGAARQRALGQLGLSGIDVSPRYGPRMRQPTVMQASRVTDLDATTREALAARLGTSSDPGDIAEALNGYHRAVGGGISVERFWLPRRPLPVNDDSVRIRMENR